MNKDEIDSDHEKVIAMVTEAGVERRQRSRRNNALAAAHLLEEPLSESHEMHDAKALQTVQDYISAECAAVDKKTFQKLIQNRFEEGIQFAIEIIEAVDIASE